MRMKMRKDVTVNSLIHNLKHGYRSLFPMKWVSLSQFHVLAGVLGFTGVVLAIRDGKFGFLRGLSSIPDTDGSSASLVLVPGLQNLGNNCFLNVILQALASCDCFHEFLQNIIERDGLSVDDRVDSMPLSVALFNLFKELCSPRDERTILSPRRVMLAMDQYIPNFNLTKQQDAAEALHHLLSSLKDETSECYVPNYGSLAELYAFPHCKILHPYRKNGLNEQERWQQDLLGPFNGILGSSLTCKSCSSQLSADFEFLISLPLTPLVINGCSVEHCLKQFTAAELIDNYRCNQCWHIAAIKYFSTGDGKHESQIEQLNSCAEEDTCECRNIFPEGVPSSNQISHTLKQLSIVRCPKILCIHLQRASVNAFGDLVKLQGHIPFPMLLDLFPFTRHVAGVGKENLGDNSEIREANQHKFPINRFNIFNHQFPTQWLQQMYEQTGDNIKLQPEPLVGNEIDETNHSVGVGIGHTFIPETGASHSEGISYSVLAGSLAHRTSGQTDENMNIPLVRDVMDDIGDSLDSEYVFASKIESDDNHSEGCSSPDMTNSLIQPIHIQSGESNPITSSKPLVGDVVGITNDSMDGKHSRSLLKESDVGSSEGHLPLQQIHGQSGENQNISSEPLVVDLLGNTTDMVYDKCDQTMKTNLGLDSSEGPYPEFTNNTPLQCDNKTNINNHVVPPKSYIYRLVSVVEHFGRVGSGHYTVYRRVKRSSDDSDSAEQLGSSNARWFCISDTDVWSVSEKAVLAADASLLFYERVEEFP